MVIKSVKKEAEEKMVYRLRKQFRSEKEKVANNKPKKSARGYVRRTSKPIEVDATIDYDVVLVNEEDGRDFLAGLEDFAIMELASDEEYDKFHINYSSRGTARRSSKTSWPDRRYDTTIATRFGLPIGFNGS